MVTWTIIGIIRSNLYFNYFAHHSLTNEYLQLTQGYTSKIKFTSVELSILYFSTGILNQNLQR